MIGLKTQPVLALVSTILFMQTRMSFGELNQNLNTRSEQKDLRSSDFPSSDYTYFQCSNECKIPVSSANTYYVDLSPNSTVSFLYDFGMSKDQFEAKAIANNMLSKFSIGIYDDGQWISLFDLSNCVYCIHNISKKAIESFGENIIYITVSSMMEVKSSLQFSINYYSVQSDSNFPPWAIIIIILGGVFLIIYLVAFLRKSKSQAKNSAMSVERHYTRPNPAFSQNLDTIISTHRTQSQTSSALREYYSRLNIIHTIVSDTQRAETEKNEFIISEDADVHFNEGLYKYFHPTFPQSICSICLEEFKPESLSRQLICNHIFHSECIRIWLSTQLLKGKACCPNCNTDIKKVQPEKKTKLLVRNIQITNTVENAL